MKRVTIGYELGEFMEYLARQGYGMEAVTIGRGLLTILPTITEGSRLRNDPAILVDGYEFESAVEEKMPAVVEVGGMAKAYKATLVEIPMIKPRSNDLVVFLKYWDID